MSTQSLAFFSKLSQNYIELLENDEYHDITIEVGKGPNVKIFRAHRSILCYRSTYLRRALASNEKNNDNILARIRIPNISPGIFQIILKYIYGGILSLNGLGTSDILKVLVAADVLHLQELVDYLQNYLIQNKIEWMEQHFDIIYQESSQSNNLLKLREKILTSLPEKSLVKFIKRDDLQMKEIDVWNLVLKWGLAQNPTLISEDPYTWSDEDFKTMRNTLQHCLPLIRFFSLSSKEFLRKVDPYKKLLNRQLYYGLLNSYMDPDIEPNDDNISLPRNIKSGGFIDSKIINLNIASIISRWIDKVEINNQFSYLRELYLPYKFKLLLRGSRDGFTPENFHSLCDDKSYTVTVIKVEGTEEILGGYNPLKWKSSDSEWDKTKDSFIFSFNSKNDLKNAILSNIKNTDYAILNDSTSGPSFGSDLVIYSWNGFESSCIQKYYEKVIRGTEDEFLIEDYEVFQLIRN